jgi:Acetoacetate decarboxylase (ADC)
MSYPTFVPYSPPAETDPQQPPDFKFEQVYMRSFPLAAPFAAVQQICDDQINTIAAAYGVDLKISAVALLLSSDALINVTVASYGRMSSLQFPNNGYSKQNELLFEIPVVITRGGVDTIGFFVPYVFVDNDWSLVTGREVMGYPKMLGNFVPSASPTKVEVLAIDAYPNEATLKPLIEIHSALQNLGGSTAAAIGGSTAAAIGGSTADAIGSRHRAPDEARRFWPFGPLDQVYRTDGPYQLEQRVLDLMQLSAGLKTTNVALKQFRDAVDTDNACYQALIQFDTVIDQTYGAGVLAPTTLDIFSYDSLKIPSRFGLAGQTQHSTLPYWIRADFVLENVQTLVEICGNGGVVPPPSGPGSNTDTRSKPEPLLVLPPVGGSKPTETPPHSCWDLMENACQLTHSALNQQADACRSIGDRMRSGAQIDYAAELTTLTRNASTYCSDLAELWLNSVATMLVRR